MVVVVVVVVTEGGGAKMEAPAAAKMEAEGAGLERGDCREL